MMTNNRDPLFVPIPFARPGVRMRWPLVLCCLLSFAAVGAPCSVSGAQEREEFSGATGQWHGFRRYDFDVEGKQATVVVPDRAAEGRPWLWHGEFFGHRPEPDIELLKRGFHVAYLRVPDMLGSPRAVEDWNAFYQRLTQRHGLSERVALVGLSRGGLYCYNWAIANPEKVACIYADAPVCDFKSWPGGKGAGRGSERDWRLVLEQYGFSTEAEALAYEGNPIDRLEPLARAGVPCLHIYGDSDEVVPWQENTGVLAERYRRLGGSIELIVKPGVGHHPHGLNDPRPIVEFIVRHASVAGSRPSGRKPRDPVDEIAAELEPSRRAVYKQVAGRELYLHCFEPEGWRPSDVRSCFVIIHGGGWSGGEPRRMYPFAEHFARLGMVGISVEYRRLDPKQGVSVFDGVRDSRSAVRFIRQHARSFGIDPNKIVVSGGSAGGHLAAGTALFGGVDQEADGVDEPGESTAVSCQPQALVLLFPVIDTSEAGYGNAKIGERWRELSPLHQVRAGVSPTLIFHGTGDTVTPFAGAKAFTEAMRRAGNRCELQVHDGGVHGYLMRDRELYLATLATTERFLESLGLLSVLP